MCLAVVHYATRANQQQLSCSQCVRFFEREAVGGSLLGHERNMSPEGPVDGGGGGEEEGGGGGGFVYF